MVGGAVAPLLINEASADPRFVDHPGLKLYGVESYIAVPLRRRDGGHFGTLCALDTRPARLTDDDLDVFRLLADLISFELEEDEASQRREEELAEERRTALLRERFIATLGHDLRAPAAAITSFAGMLLRGGGLTRAQAEDVRWIVSSAERMNRLVADLLDFARGRLGGGLQLDASAPTDLRRLCRQAVRELRAQHPGRKVRVTGEGELAGIWDEARVSQAITNLLDNALRYSPADTTVAVRLRGTGDEVSIEVHNRGAPIPDETLRHVFDPFRRGRPDAEGDKGGLGLGLYIVEQVVRAHGGRVSARSDAVDGTTFRVELPRAASDRGG